MSARAPSPTAPGRPRVVSREHALDSIDPHSVVRAPRAVHMEIIEVATRHVWLAPAPIAPDAYAAFDPGPGFAKSGAAASPMDFVGFRRSPGMPADGPATGRRIGDHAFIHVAIPALPPERPFGPGGPMRLVVVKHQTVGFDAGAALAILCLPDGTEYVQQTGSVADPARIGLPEGWTLRSVVLTGSLTIEMQDDGPVTWWLPGRQSFQGPVPDLPR
ncbi:MAG TPA: hypothetical protein ENO23_11695 [Alphaproteobacteria bacterium]|nr:hypothetical protein [Alphaproteobacteria bacterium]